MRATTTILAAMLAMSAQAGACRLERLAYAPGENLEAIDVAFISKARKSIDFSAYVLTSIPIVEALDAAVARANVEARYKGSPQPFMHLKAYAIDGALLREGAGNFTHSGLLRQDNSLVALRCREAVARFQKQFEQMWGR